MITDDLEKRGEVSYNVTVISGGSIDVFLMGADNYALWDGGRQYGVIEEGTVRNTASVDKEITLDPGSCCLIIDNTWRGGAYTGQDVTYVYEKKLSDEVTMGERTLAAAVIVVPVVLVLFLLRRRGSGRSPPPRKRKKPMSRSSPGDAPYSRDSSPHILSHFAAQLPLAMVTIASKAQEM